MLKAAESSMIPLKYSGLILPEKMEMERAMKMAF